MKKRSVRRTKSAARRVADAQVAEFERRDLGSDIRAARTARLLRVRSKPTSIVLDDDLVRQLRAKAATIHSASGAQLNVGTMLEASAPGYKTGSSGVLRVVRPALMLNLPAEVPVGASVPFSVGTAPRFIGGVSQPVHSDGPVTVSVASSNTVVGQVQTATPGSMSPVNVLIQPGSSATPATVADGGVEFVPLSTGTTTVSADATGFQGAVVDVGVR